jgi:hypothetical protein
MAFKRDVAKKAMERLQDLELVALAEGISKCPREFRMMRLLVEPEQGMVLYVVQTAFMLYFTIIST